MHTNFPTLRILFLLISLFQLAGCQSVAKPLFTQGTSINDPIDQMAWIVTPEGTMLQKMDGVKTTSNYTTFPARSVRDWVAVSPGNHELTLFYSDSSRLSAAPTVVPVNCVAGQTTYVFGKLGGGISYHYKLIDQPADQELINYIGERIRANRLP